MPFLIVLLLYFHNCIFQVFASDRCKNEGQTFISHDPKYFLTCHLSNGKLYEIRLQCKGNEYYDMTNDKCNVVPGGGFALYRHVSQICPKDFVGTLKDPNVPQIYHVCLGGHDITASCYGEDVYNESVKKCVSQGELQTIVLRDDSNGLIPVPDCKWEGTFAVPFYSKYYYKCTKGKTPLIYQEIYKCEEPMVFNMATESCVERTNTIKFLKLIPAEDCRQYYHCVSLAADDKTFKCSLKHCPNNTMYDKSSTRCVPSRNMTCVARKPKREKVPRRGAGASQLLYNATFGKDHVEIIDEAPDHDEALVKIEAVRVRSIEDNKKDVQVDLLINVPDDGPLLSQLLNMENNGEQGENIIHLMGPATSTDAVSDTKSTQTEQETGGTTGFINDKDDTRRSTIGKENETLSTLTNVDNLEISITPTTIPSASITIPSASTTISSASTTITSASTEGSVSAMASTEQLPDISTVGSKENLGPLAGGSKVAHSGSKMMNDNKKEVQTTSTVAETSSKTSDAKTTTPDPEDNFYEGEVNGENLLLKVINEDTPMTISTQNDTEEQSKTTNSDNVFSTTPQFQDSSMVDKIFRNKNKLRKIMRHHPDIEKNLTTKYYDANRMINRLKQVFKLAQPYDQTISINLDSRRDSVSMERDYNKAIEGIRNISKLMPKYNSTDPDEKQTVKNIWDYIKNDVLYGMRQDRDYIKEAMENETDLEKKKELEEMVNELQTKILDLRNSLKDLQKEIAAIPMFHNESFINKNPNLESYEDMSEKSTRKPRRKLKRIRFQTNSYERKMTDVTTEAIVSQTSKKKKKYKKIKLEREVYKKSFNKDEPGVQEPIAGTEGNARRNRKPTLKTFGDNEDRKPQKPQEKTYSDETELWLDILNELIDKWVEDVKFKDGISSEEKQIRGNIREFFSSQAIPHASNKSEPLWNNNDNLSEESFDLDNLADVTELNVSEKSAEMKQNPVGKPKEKHKLNTKHDAPEDKKIAKRIHNVKQNEKSQHPRSRKNNKEKETKRKTTLSTPELTDFPINIETDQLYTETPTDGSIVDLTAVGTRISKENINEKKANRRMDHVANIPQEEPNEITEETNSSITSSVGKKENATNYDLGNNPKENPIATQVDIPAEENHLYGLPELLMAVNKAPGQRFHTHHIYYNHPVNEDEHGSKSDEPVIIINEDENVTNESYAGGMSEESEEGQLFGKAGDNVEGEKTVIVKPGVVEEKLKRIFRKGGPEKEEGNIEIVEELIDTQYGNKDKNV